MKLSRRTFIASSSAAAIGGALVIGFHLKERSPTAFNRSKDNNPFDAWVHVKPDGKTILVLKKCEMGQGVYTGLPMILADEAELDWKTVTVQQSLESTGTGGSGSTSGGYLPLRRAGAMVREAMIAAAAHEWGVPRTSCIARQSRVLHHPTGRTLSYANLVAIATKLPLPDLDEVQLKKPTDFNLIGKRVLALDIPEKALGTACFGLDVRLPGMVYATVARCPVFGGKPKVWDGRKALLVPGVLKVFEIEPRGFQIYTAGGVVVVANSTWAALQGRKALTITWDYGAHRNESTEKLNAAFRQALKREGKVVRKDGEIGKVFAGSKNIVTATYQFPFLAHATMEPMNITIHLQSDRCEVWCPSQSPDWARSAIAKELRLMEQQVVVHTTFMGGGFGRRYIGDYPTEAAQIARHIESPVQLVWSREDDMTHDFYRPTSHHQLQGALDGHGRVGAWSHHVASTSIRVQWDPPATVKPESAEIGGAVDPPYWFPAMKVSYTPVDSAVPRGWWRSVENSFNGFVVESFMDELASSAGKDPYLFRRENLTEMLKRSSNMHDAPDIKRLLAVLDLAAEKSGWGAPMARGRGRGIACGTAYGYLAQVAEVTTTDNGIHVDRVVTALDCGQIVNPNGAQQQIEGGIVFALSAVLKGKITIASGQVEQTNFDGYDLIRMPESPLVEVHFVENHLSPSGIGEAAVPYLGPAIANACFAATGKRLRKLPLSLDEESE